jgi:peptidoglycan/LPS O-acetylase OafA/YrhL
MKLTYRPEIDGLRAIAVIAVIFYHAKIKILGHQLFQGGFIGVDIFFVISGYLIASIILKELVFTGSFSFQHFYERRIRRILPALLFVILVSLPFAWIALLPNNFTDFSKSVLYSLGFSSNFYFHYTDQVYGAENGLSKPFLHTWSLSVEEQFYILFPIVLLFIFKYFRKYLIHILIIGFFISLSLANWDSKNHPSFSFYMLPTRVWELLAGSILAYYEIIKGHRSKNKLLILILPITGLLLIGHSILFFNDRMFHPSINTLSPIIGVCLIIWYSDRNEIITKILSTKLFVGIGLISYSLYLWHYPIFAFFRVYFFIEGSLFNKLFIKLLIGIIILIISIFSYYLIEKPFRNKNNKFKFVFLIIILNYLIIFGSNFFILSNKNFLFDKKLLEFNELENTRNSWEKCNIKKKTNINDYCKIGNYNDQVFLIGDSHLIPLINNLSKRLNKKNYELINLTQTGKLYRRKLRSDERVSFLKNIKNSILIFGGYYQRETENELKQLYSSYKEDFENFMKNNNKIIFLTPVPEVNVLPKAYNFKQVIKGKKIDISVKKTKIIDRNKFANNFINKFKEILIVDLNEIFCDEFKCYAITPEKLILKSDFDHPSFKGAEKINNLIIKEIEKIELKSK